MRRARRQAAFRTRGTEAGRPCCHFAAASLSASRQGLVVLFVRQKEGGSSLDVPLAKTGDMGCVCRSLHARSAVAPDRVCGRRDGCAAPYRRLRRHHLHLAWRHETVRGRLVRSSRSARLLHGRLRHAVRRARAAWRRRASFRRRAASNRGRFPRIHLAGVSPAGRPIRKPARPSGRPLNASSAFDHRFNPCQAWSSRGHS